jgi:hypothetical protein
VAPRTRTQYGSSFGGRAVVGAAGADDRGAGTGADGVAGVDVGTAWTAAAVGAGVGTLTAVVTAVGAVVGVGLGAAVALGAGAWVGARVALKDAATVGDAVGIGTGFAVDAVSVGAGAAAGTGGVGLHRSTKLCTHGMRPLITYRPTAASPRISTKDRSHRPPRRRGWNSSGSSLAGSAGSGPTGSS